MNPLEDLTTSNEFGELSEEEMMKIVGGAAIVKANTTINSLIVKIKAKI